MQREAFFFTESLATIHIARVDTDKEDHHLIFKPTYLHYNLKVFYEHCVVFLVNISDSK